MNVPPPAGSVGQSISVFTGDTVSTPVDVPASTSCDVGEIAMLTAGVGVGVGVLLPPSPPQPVSVISANAAAIAGTARKLLINDFFRFSNLILLFYKAIAKPSHNTKA